MAAGHRKEARLESLRGPTKARQSPVLRASEALERPARDYSRGGKVGTGALLPTRVQKQDRDQDQSQGSLLLALILPIQPSCGAGHSRIALTRNSWGLMKQLPQSGLVEAQQ